MTQIAGKTALITGAASGIGLAMAHSLAARGARLIIADISAERLEEAGAELRQAGADVATVAFNVAEEAEWQKAEEAAASFGHVDILCSNAGVGGGSGALEEYDPDVWRWAYAVNAHAHLYACRSFLGAMKRRGEGHVVLTASMVGIVPPPVSVAYCSSKFATVGIAMSLRNELAGTGVGISMLCPGMSATRIVLTTKDLRPGEQEAGAAAQTADAMGGVLASGMDPRCIGDRVAEAISSDEFYIFTHEEWKRLVEPQVAEMLAAFGPSADPDYAGDDIDSLLAANNATAFGAGRTAS